MGDDIAGILLVRAEPAGRKTGPHVSVQIVTAFT
jgi:hypothetical protein